MQELEIPDPPGAGPVAVELALQRGHLDRGQADREGDRKARRERLAPLLSVPREQVCPAAPGLRSATATPMAWDFRTATRQRATVRSGSSACRAERSSGRSCIDKPYLEGAGSEAIKGMNEAGHFETYRNPVNPGKLFPTVMKEINPPADAELVHVDLEVTTGPSVRLTVVDPEGNPIAGLKTNGRSGRSSYDRDDMAKPDAEVTNLMPDEERIVLLRHEGRKLGKVVTVKKGDDASGPVVVKLAPLADDHRASGRRRRKPDRRRQRFAPTCFPHGDFGSSLGQVVTGADGRFRVTDVPTGCDYGLAVETNAPIKGRRFAYHTKAAVKPGETTDIGEITSSRSG